MPQIHEFIELVLAAILAATMALSLNKNLRVFHILLAAALSVAGFISGSVATGIVSAGVFLGSIYLFNQMPTLKESFNILQVKGSNEYLTAFIEYYKRDIYHYSPFYKRSPESNCFLILNNIEVIGVLIYTTQDKSTLHINLDFVIPKYRNNKVGKYLFEENIKYFGDLGFDKIITVCLNETHKTYLSQIGFSEQVINGETLFVKEIK